MNESGNDDLMPHFIFCVGDFFVVDNMHIKEFILTNMRKYGIQASLFTTLWMSRVELITKETSKKAYEGKLEEINENWYRYDGSMNDDLERFMDIRNAESIGVEPEFYWPKRLDIVAQTFFLPKLTEEELELVEQHDADHMLTYQSKNPDVDRTEMIESDSKDKYLHSFCHRYTQLLELDSSKKSIEKKQKCCKMM